MEQTEIFSHFMSGRADKTGKPGKSDGYVKHSTRFFFPFLLASYLPSRIPKRLKKTEKDEDDEMIKEAMEDFGPSASGTRLTVQPSCILSFISFVNLQRYSWQNARLSIAWIELAHKII
jgi:hypothetical protein